MLMAQAGAEVTLFERAERVGGRCAAIEAEGFRFDTGPTFFLYPRVLEEIFQSVGRNLWRDVPMTRLDPQYRLEFGAGGRIDATPDLERMRSEIARIAPQDADSFVRFMNENRIKLERFRPILESPFSSMLDLLRPSVLKAAPWVRPWSSVAGDLSSTHRPRRRRSRRARGPRAGSRWGSLRFWNTNTASSILTEAVRPSARRWPRSLVIWVLMFG